MNTFLLVDIIQNDNGRVHTSYLNISKVKGNRATSLWKYRIDSARSTEY